MVRERTETSVGGGRTVVPVVGVAVNDINSDELHNLQLSEVALPPRRDSESCDKVVVVHRNVNKGVEHAGDPLDGDIEVQAPPHE